MSIELRKSAVTEWRRNWTVVLAATAGVFYSTINVYSAGLFFEPFEREFGWTRAQISFGPAIPAFATILLGPFMGAAIDRFGPRRIGMAGALSLCGLTALLSTSGPSIWSWWALWGLLAVNCIFIQPTVWTSAVSGLFRSGRGLALAVTLCGSGIGSMVTPLLTYTLIARFGWRMAFVGLALIWGAIVIPVVLFFFTSVKDRERTQGQNTAIPKQEPVIGAAGNLPRKIDLLLSWRFVRLALAGFLIAIVVVTFAVSLVPILSSNGFSRAQAAGIAALLGVSSISGRLLIGFLLDRWEGRYLASFCVCLPIITSLLLIMLPGSISAATAAVLVLGLALGAELDLVAYLTSRHFELRRFGLVFGTIAGLITLAGAAGPWILNLAYDSQHSYLPGMWASIPMCVTSAILFILLGPYPAEKVEQT